MYNTFTEKLPIPIQYLNIKATATCYIYLIQILDQKELHTFFCRSNPILIFYISIFLYLSLKFKVESVSGNQVLLCIISSTSNDINAIYLVINLTRSHHFKSLMFIHGMLLNILIFCFVGPCYHWLHHISLNLSGTGTKCQFDANKGIFWNRELNSCFKPQKENLYIKTIPPASEAESQLSHANNK